MKRSRSQSRRLFATCVGALLASMLAPSCAKKADDPTGELMLAIQTDMSIPKDVDAVWIEVSSYGNTVFRNRYEVGPSGVKIPATLAIQASPGKSPPVTIRVISEHASVTRTLREVVTTVPPDRVATLRMPIQWLCDGSGQRIPNTTPPQFSNGCPAGQTCVGGSCASSDVDSTKLPSFKPGDVYGGGSGDGDGTCFDTVTCLSTNTPLSVDLQTCTVDVSQLGGAQAAHPDGGTVGSDGDAGVPPSGAATTARAALDAASLNIGLELPIGGDGICNDNACFVPLDGDTGWVLDNTTLKLPPAVCERLSAGTILEVVASTSCPTKTAGTPTCGPWSSVGGGAATTDAGSGDDGGNGDAAVGEVISCGNQQCPTVGTPPGDLSPCCPTSPDPNTCGLDVSRLGGIPANTCLATHQASIPDNTCPSINTPYGTLLGCCRADTYQCGAQADTLTIASGVPTNYGLGCVDTAAFGDYGTQGCGSTLGTGGAAGSSGGGSGGTGGAGTAGTAGAAGAGTAGAAGIGGIGGSGGSGGTGTGGSGGTGTGGSGTAGSAGAAGSASQDAGGVGCNPQFCPNPGSGTACCVTPTGPCGADQGSGCQ